MIDATRDSGDNSDSARKTAGVAAKGEKHPLVQRSARIRYHTTVLIAASLIIALSGWLQLKNTEEIEFPFWGTLPGICAWKNMSGIECPGCGLSRCFVEIGHGHWRSAWHYNPAGFLIFGLVVYQIPFRGLQLKRLWDGNSDRSYQFFYVNLTVWIIVTALVVQWIARQIL